MNTRSPPVGQNRSKRPEIRNLSLGQIVRYRLPGPGIVSILHRVSGAGMFLLLPFVLWLLDLSLASADSFERLRAAVQSPLSRLLIAGLIWAFLHHVVAGIRFLLLDLHIGIAKQPAQRGATVVLVASGLAALLAAAYLFGVL